MLKAIIKYTQSVLQRSPSSFTIASHFRTKLNYPTNKQFNNKKTTHISNAGFYSQHYVEYLVSAIAKANIDSLPILDLTDCVQELRRRGIALPERGPWDTDEIYRGMCQEVSCTLLFFCCIEIPIYSVWTFDLCIFLGLCK